MSHEANTRAQLCGRPVIPIREVRVPAYPSKELYEEWSKLSVGAAKKKFQEYYDRLYGATDGHLT
jgi:hypothetical protein